MVICRICKEDFFIEENKHCIESFENSFSEEEKKLIQFMDHEVCFDCFRSGILLMSHVIRAEPSYSKYSDSELKTLIDKLKKIKWSRASH